MFEQLTLLHKLPDYMYISDSPVIIEKGALYKDDENSIVLAKLKIKNLTDDTIIACKASIRAYEINGNELDGVEVFSFLDLNIAPNKSFGSQTPIYLPNNTTRKISVCVTEVVFASGKIWTNPECEWKQALTLQPISDILTKPEILKQYQRDVGKNCKYLPKKENGFYVCTCGTVSKNDICHNCQRSLGSLIAGIESETLKNNLAAHNKKKNDLIKKSLKISIISGIAIILMIAFFSVFGLYIYPNMRYNTALSLIEKGKYAEATKIFNEIKDANIPQDWHKKFPDGSLVWKCSKETNISSGYSWTYYYDINGKAQKKSILQTKGTAIITMSILQANVLFQLYLVFLKSMNTTTTATSPNINMIIHLV